MTTRDRRQRLAALLAMVLALAVLALTPACARKTDPSTQPRDIEGQIAEHGATVAGTLQRIQTLGVQLEQSGALPTRTALALQEGMKRASEGGVRLAPLLRAVDSGRAAATEVAQARSITASIITELDVALRSLGASAATQQLVALIREGLTAAEFIRSALATRAEGVTHVTVAIQ